MLFDERGSKELIRKELGKAEKGRGSLFCLLQAQGEILAQKATWRSVEEDSDIDSVIYAGNRVHMLHPHKKPKQNPHTHTGKGDISKMKSFNTINKCIKLVLCSGRTNDTRSQAGSQEHVP